MQQNYEDFQNRYKLRRKNTTPYYRWEDMMDYLTETQYYKFLNHIIDRNVMWKKLPRYGVPMHYVKSFLDG